MAVNEYFDLTDSRSRSRDSKQNIKIPDRYAIVRQHHTHQWMNGNQHQFTIRQAQTLSVTAVMSRLVSGVLCEVK